MRFSAFSLSGTSAVLLATAAFGSVGGPRIGVTPDVAVIYRGSASTTKIYYSGSLGRGSGGRTRDVLEGAAGGEWEHCAGG